jgi:hypothetical protein
MLTVDTEMNLAYAFRPIVIIYDVELYFVYGKTVVET